MYFDNSMLEHISLLLNLLTMKGFWETNEQSDIS